MHLFDAVRFPVDPDPAAIDMGGAAFETFDAAYARVEASLVGHLPPNLRRLRLFLPEPRASTIAKAIAENDDAVLDRINAMREATDHVKPLIGLLRAVLGGQYPLLEFIRVDKTVNTPEAQIDRSEVQHAYLEVPGTEQQVHLMCTDAHYIEHWAKTPE